MIVIFQFVLLLTALDHLASEMMRVLLVDVLEQSADLCQLSLLLLASALSLANRRQQVLFNLLCKLEHNRFIRFDVD